VTAVSESPVQMQRGGFDPHEVVRTVEAIDTRLRELEAAFSLGPVQDATALLGRLEHALHRHFAVEEDPGGSFDAILLRAPQLEARLASLRKDHVPLREQVAKLREEARCAGEVWTRVRAHFEPSLQRSAATRAQKTPSSRTRS
jgi:hypothetical protein